jgi:hypothetical protein
MFVSSSFNTYVNLPKKREILEILPKSIILDEEDSSENLELVEL